MSAALQSLLHHHGRTRRAAPEDWLSLFASNGFLAAIFDCDGTLANSSEAHFHAMAAAAMDQGARIERDWYFARTGLDRQSLFAAFSCQRQPSFDVARACRVSIERYLELAHLVRPIGPVVAFANALKHQGIPLAVATNGERCVANLSLAAIGLRNGFDHVVSISDGVRPKPAEDLFMLAAERLDHAPNRILVLEDSPQGVRAAQSAGMSVIELL